MNPSPPNALGIDVGGTKIAAGIVSLSDGRVSARRQIPTSPSRGGAAVLDDVEGLAGDLFREAQSRNLPILGLGVGLCELVSPDGTILSANCIQWQDQPVAARLSPFGPMKIEADVRAGAMAEARFGAGQPFTHF